MTRQELIEWGEATLELYQGIANRKGWDNVPAFYTQSNLNTIVGVDNLDVFIAGINPGSGGSFRKMTDNWNIDKENGMTAEQLISGNFCMVNQKEKKTEGDLHEEKKTAWDLHGTWAYFKRLKQYFSLLTDGNPLDDESRFILTNASFFATCKADGLKKIRLTREEVDMTILQTIKLLKIANPKRVIFLSGKAVFQQLDRLCGKFNIVLECGSILYGTLETIPCLGVPHPSAHLSRESRSSINRIVRTFIENGTVSASDIDVAGMTTVSTNDKKWNSGMRVAAYNTLNEFLSKNSELKPCCKGDGKRLDWDGFLHTNPDYELYVTQRAGNGFQFFTDDIRIIDILTGRHSFIKDHKRDNKFILDFSKTGDDPINFISCLMDEINNCQ